MFEVKKVIGAMLMPLPLLGIVCFVCLVLSLRSHKISSLLGLLSVVTLLVISTPYAAQQIINPSSQLKYVFKVKAHPQLDKIVVLGCDIHPNPHLTVNSQLGNCAKSRLVEGLRLAHYYPKAQLIVSGGGIGKVTNSYLMQQTAISLGIDANRIKQNPSALDTADEAQFLAPALVDFNVALVTSASHMARAKDLFNAQGVDIIPAATDFYDFSLQPYHKQFIPNANVLQAVSAHWHEVIGSSWITLRRWVDPESL